MSPLLSLARGFCLLIFTSDPLSGSSQPKGTITLSGHLVPACQCEPAGISALIDTPPNLPCRITLYDLWKCDILW